MDMRTQKKLGILTMLNIYALKNTVMIEKTCAMQRMKINHFYSGFKKFKQKFMDAYNFEYLFLCKLLL